MLGSIFGKALHDMRRALLGWSVGISATVLLMSALWTSFSDVDFEEIFEQYPEAFLEAFNVTDMSTATGYLNAELYSLMLPFMFIIFAVGKGASSIAGEEEGGTLEVLASLPVPRSRLLLEKAAAVVAGVGVLAAVLLASSWIGSLVFDLGIPVRHVVNASLSMFLLGAEFGLVGLALSATTGRRGLSIGVTGALAGGSYVLFLAGQLVEQVEPFLELSPFYQAISEGPLGPGLPLLVLAMPLVGIVAAGVALPVFDRRDLAAI